MRGKAYQRRRGTVPVESLGIAVAQACKLEEKDNLGRDCRIHGAKVQPQACTLFISCEMANPAKESDDLFGRNIGS